MANGDRMMDGMDGMHNRSVHNGRRNVNAAGSRGSADDGQNARDDDLFGMFVFRPERESLHRAILPI